MKEPSMPTEKPRIVYVTNPVLHYDALDSDQRDDWRAGASEDSLFAKSLANKLGSHCDIHLRGIDEALESLNNKDAQPSLFLLRNVWPFSFFKDQLHELGLLAQKKNIPFYNPVTAEGLVDNKAYLVELTQQKAPVIPTILVKKDLRLAGSAPSPRYLLVRP